LTEEKNALTTQVTNLTGQVSTLTEEKNGLSSKIDSLKQQTEVLESYQKIISALAKGEQGMAQEYMSGLANNTAYAEQVGVWKLSLQNAPKAGAVDPLIVDIITSMINNNKSAALDKLYSMDVSESLYRENARGWREQLEPQISDPTKEAVRQQDQG
jgi:hypothetical protein